MVVLVIATPPESVTVLMKLPSLVKVTVPVGVPEPEAELTVAVKVTDAPRADGFGELNTAVFVSVAAAAGAAAAGRPTRASAHVESSQRQRCAFLPLRPTVSDSYADRTGRPSSKLRGRIGSRHAGEDPSFTGDGRGDRRPDLRGRRNGSGERRHDQRALQEG